MVLRFAIGGAYIRQRITGREKLSQRDPYAEFGTARFKLARRDSPATSVEAAASIDTSRLEKLVYETIKDSGAKGLISDEVRQALADHHLTYSSVTARYKGLSEKGLIHYTGATRKGGSGRRQRVMVAVR